jgi:predicted dehydrogenase
MAKIRIGLVGCGFVSELHMYAYRRVYGVDVEVKASRRAVTMSSILPAGIKYRGSTAAFAT